MRRLVAVLVLILGAATAQADTTECRNDRVDLRGDWGQTQFTIELADTPAARGRGLMFRETMPRGAGMLFVYEQPQRASFWMKNTLIPLDMIFVDRTGHVTRVHSGAVPGDLTPIDGGPGVFAVLEINATLAARYGIAPGSELRHPVFSGEAAAWPC